MLPTGPMKHLGTVASQLQMVSLRLTGVNGKPVINYSQTHDSSDQWKLNPTINWSTH